MAIPKNLFLPLNMGRAKKNNSDSPSAIPNKSVSIEEWLTSKGITKNLWENVDGVMSPKIASNLSFKTGDLGMLVVKDGYAFIGDIQNQFIAGVLIDGATKRALFGNTDTSTGGLLYDDATKEFNLAALTAVSVATPSFKVFEAGSVPTVEVKEGNVLMPVLPIHADEAAAVTAGLVQGTMYITATGEVRGKL
jgi:hypothetical protein